MSGAEKKPNIVFIMLDDFGVGQFAPQSKSLRVDQFNPDHIKYIKSLKENAYSSEDALACSQAAMPTLSKLAETGMLFTNTFAASNLCAPARIGVMTGRNPNSWGAYRNIDVEPSGLSKADSLAKNFQASAYSTGFIGKWHLGHKDESLKNKVLAKYTHLKGKAKAKKVQAELTKNGYFGSVIKRDHPLNNGFDYYFGYNRWECPFYDSQLIWENDRFTGLQKQYNTELFTDKAIDFIQNSLPKEKPFFLNLSYHAVHDPLAPRAPEKYFKPFNTSSETLSKFYAHVYAVDQGVKKIMNFLETHHQLDNTIIIFSADNGATCTRWNALPGNAPYRGTKGQMIQGGFRVPLLIWHPKVKNSKRTSSEMVSTMDILPTALDFSGINFPEDLDGKSLKPIISDQSQAPVRDTLTWAGIHSRAWGFDKKMVPGYQEKWREGSPGSWVIVQGDYLLRYIGPVKVGIKAYPQGRQESYELYNLKNDIAERDNLFHSRPEIAKRLIQQYKDQSKQFPQPIAWKKFIWEYLVNPHQ